ncbi:hypothetical protein [Streptomyces sp. 8N706]|uniref:hypothetical protein n=1 Tax=Streptomyces sp. 8N706 TaxID=3457416 RepID=UPI003FCF4F85
MVRRRAGRGGLAAVAALCAVAVMPGTALADGAGDLPAYRTAEGAKKAHGVASSADAETIAPGVYTDTIGRGEERYYGVTLDAKSSAFISAVAAPAPGTKIADYGDTLKVVLEDNEGNECGSGDATFAGDGMAYPIGAYASRRIGGGVTQCQSPGPYLLKVAREGEATSDPGRWPIEIRYMSEPGLKGSIPAEPGKGSWSSATPVPPSGATKKEARGGTGFNDARSVGKGVWRDRIKPGETRFYRVPVDWGQQLNVSAELPNAPGNKDISDGYVPQGLGLAAYNPARGAVDDDNFADYEGKQSAAKLFTAPVDYGNRFSSTADISAMCFAGWYYLAVSMHPDTAQFFKSGTDLTLRVDLKGSPKAGPAYAGDAAKAGFGVTADDREMADKGQTAAESAESDTMGLVATAGIGTGTVLVLGLGVWMLVARRRTPATVTPAPSTPVVPHSTQSPPGAQPGQPHLPYQSPQQEQQYGPPRSW